MDLTSTIEVGGDEVEVELPGTAREVLDYLAFVSVKHDEAIDEPEKYPSVTRHIVQWLGRYVEGGADRADKKWTFAEAMDAAMKIIEAASIPKTVRQGLVEFARIHGVGGCECPLCRSPEEMADAKERTLEIVRGKCNFSEIDEDVVALAAMTRPAREGNLSEAPWYLYQIDDAIETGLTRGRRSRRDRKKGSSKMKKALGG